MNFDQFKRLSKEYNLIPVYEIITADLLTPVLAYLKIRKKGEQNFNFQIWTKTIVETCKNCIE